ncbi:MAG: histidine phosphatase family protein [Planctomycetota bacterium]
MTTLLLMRHAKSAWSNSQLADHDRPLNDRGRKAAPLMARYLMANYPVPSTVLCSSAVRTRETWDLMADAFGHSQSEGGPGRGYEVIYLDELYLASGETILQHIRSDHLDAETLLVLGHNPGMSIAASYLATEPIEMKTAAVAAFELGDAWDGVHPSQAVLKELVKPKDLADHDAARRLGDD